MKRRNKYGAKPTVLDGVSFHSKKEAKRWAELKLLEHAGEIACLERQVKIPLIGRDGPILTPTGRQAHYIADFTYVDWRLNGVKVVEDAKGYATEPFKLKKAILRAQGVEVSTS